DRRGGATSASHGAHGARTAPSRGPGRCYGDPPVVAGRRPATGVTSQAAVPRHEPPACRSSTITIPPPHLASGDVAARRSLWSTRSSGGVTDRGASVAHGAAGAPREPATPPTQERRRAIPGAATPGAGGVGGAA